MRNATQPYCNTVEYGCVSLRRPWDRGWKDPGVGWSRDSNENLFPWEGR